MQVSERNEMFGAMIIDILSAASSSSRRKAFLGRVDVSQGTGIHLVARWFSLVELFYTRFIGTSIACLRGKSSLQRVLRHILTYS